MDRIVRQLKAHVRSREVRAIINFCWNKGNTVSYIEIAKAIGTFSGGKELAEALGAIMKEDTEAQRPLTCALVVRTDTNRPGDGFFESARSLGHQIPNNPKDEKAFWQKQVHSLLAIRGQPWARVL